MAQTFLRLPARRAPTLWNCKKLVWWRQTRAWACLDASQGLGCKSEPHLPLARGEYHLLLPTTRRHVRQWPILSSQVLESSQAWVSEIQSSTRPLLTLESPMPVTSKSQERSTKTLKKGETISQTCYTNQRREQMIRLSGKLSHYIVRKTTVTSHSWTRGSQLDRKIQRVEDQKKGTIPLWTNKEFKSSQWTRISHS